MAQIIKIIISDADLIIEQQDKHITNNIISFLRDGYYIVIQFELMTYSPPDVETLINRILNVTGKKNFIRKIKLNNADESLIDLIKSTIIKWEQVENNKQVNFKNINYTYNCETKELKKL